MAASNIQDKMIRSVYIMGYCSISSTIVSTLLVFSLSVFCPFHTNYIKIHFLSDDKMYNLVSVYFPSFWCCSSFFYMFNFVRNRAFFASKFKYIFMGISALTQIITQFKNNHISPPNPSIATNASHQNNKNLHKLKPGTPSAIHPQSSYHSTASIQSLPSIPASQFVNDVNSQPNVASLVLPIPSNTDTSPSAGTEPSVANIANRILDKQVIVLNPNYNPFTDSQNARTVAVERVTDVIRVKSKSCRSTYSNDSNNSKTKMILRAIKSEGEQMGNDGVTFTLCAPPTSIPSIDEVCNNPGIDSDYDIKSSDDEESLPTRVPVLRQPYSISDVKKASIYTPYCGITHVSVATESSGGVSNSITSPKLTNDVADNNYIQNRFRAKSSPKVTNINYYEHNDDTNYQQQNQKKPKTPHVLDEKTEFVVPLSVIEDARSLDETLVKPSSPSNKGIQIHRNENCLPNTTKLNHNLSNHSQISYGSNGLQEISYTQNTNNSITHNTDTHGTYYSTKSARLIPIRDNKDISMTQTNDNQESVSIASAPIIVCGPMRTTVAITRVESGSKDSSSSSISNHYHKKKKSRKYRMRQFFRVNKKAKVTDNEKYNGQKQIGVAQHKVNMDKCQSLPVTPRIVDSTSSPSSDPSMGSMIINGDRMLRHSEPDKYINNNNNDIRNIQNHDLSLSGMKMDNSMDSMTTSINIHAMHHGQHALSAPEEEIINHYQNAQQEIKENMFNNKTALMDMMVSYGWTDQALLSSLQSLRRFSR